MWTFVKIYDNIKVSVVYREKGEVILGKICEML